ncbi:MAG: DUF1549 domain-containing protein, partial [Planctomycetaceae bacterium]|nr:DUF1549 domain-containing protein [Planctomycetaceae bacterium]
MRHPIRGSIVWLLLCVPTIALAEDEPTKQQIEFFEKKIRPILVDHCYECHSAKSDDIGGKLLLDSRAAILKGGESGPAVSMEKAERSLLVDAMEYRDGLEMPPDDKLPDDVIADFRKWVAMGAPDPRRPKKVNDKLAQRAEALWSLKPVKKSELPKVKDGAWPINDIDSFILARLEEKGIAPVAGADAYTLCRRIHFDVIGLPPSPAAVEDFVKNYNADAQSAIESLVDQLLESPQFGARWARHWLDVARYAESNGKSRDVLFPYAWRYRNWAIDAFNADMPFSQFVTEQIAGDLLEADSTSRRDSQRVATGLLAVGSKPISGGNLQFDLIDDQIDVVTRGFLGMTASCARCHDHKFDPIPTADYYALAGIFNSTKTLYGGGLKRPKKASDAAKVWMVLGDDPKQKLKRAEELQKEFAKVQKQRGTAQKKLQNLQRGKKKNKETIAAAKQRFDLLDAQFKTIQQQQELLKLQFAMGVTDAPKTADMAVLIRGDRKSRGDVVPRGFLSFV